MYVLVRFHFYTFMILQLRNGRYSIHLRPMPDRHRLQLHASRFTQFLQTSSLTCSEYRARCRFLVKSVGSLSLDLTEFNCWDIFFKVWEVPGLETIRAKR